MANNLVTVPRCKVTDVSLEFPARLPYDDWSAIGPGLDGAKEWLNFAIGDWLNYGEITYGETYAQAATELGIDEQRLMQLKYCAKAVDPLIRIKNLKVVRWSHHYAVAKLPKREQQRWLQRCLKNQWTVRELTDQLVDAGVREKRNPRSAPTVEIKHSVDSPAETLAKAQNGKDDIERCACCQMPASLIKICGDCLRVLKTKKRKEARDAPELKAG